MTNLGDLADMLLSTGTPPQRDDIMHCITMPGSQNSHGSGCFQNVTMTSPHPLDGWSSGLCSRLQMSWLWPMLILGSGSRKPHAGTVVSKSKSAMYMYKSV